MKYFFLLIGLILCLFGLPNCQKSTPTNPDIIRVALLPDENAATIIQNNGGLKKYLEESLGKKIELVVTTDYSSMIEAMRRGRLELGYFGPLSYVMAKEKSPDIEVFAVQVKNGSSTYNGVIIGNVEANIKSVADVRGKTMAYGDMASTSSHLIPKSILRNKKIVEKKDYSEQFLGSHDAVALAVQNGTAQMGGLSKPIFDALVTMQTIDLNKVNVIEVSDNYPNYPWTIRSNLDSNLKEKIKKSFFRLSDKEILKPLKADGFIEASDNDYDIIRDLAKVLEMDVSKN